MNDLRQDFINRLNWEIERELIPELSQLVNANITQRISKTRAVLEKDMERAKRIQGYWQNIHQIMRMGLSAIPVAGGYINWAYQFGSGDLSTVYKLFRAGFGDDSQTRMEKDFGLSWWPEGNGVMGPLGPGDSTMDYSTGRVAAFSDNAEAKALQLECDVVDYVTSQINLNENSSDNLSRMQDSSAGSLIYQGMPGLVALAHTKAENWAYYAIALVVQSIPLNDHNAIKDLRAGFLFTEVNGEQRIITGACNDFWNKKPWLQSSKDSTFYTKYLTKVNFNSLKASLPAVVTTPTLNRVLASKAEIYSYLDDKVDAISEAAGESMTELFSGSEETSKITEFSGFQKHGKLYKAMIGRGGILRNMWFFVPSKIYNKNTTWSGKNRGRVLCGIGAFYNVLQSYIDFPFVSNMAYNENNTRLLMQAILDAFWTAYLFMKKQGVSDGADALLYDVIKSDPSIQAYFINGITQATIDKYSDRATEMQYGVYDAMFDSGSNSKGATPFVDKAIYSKDYTGKNNNEGKLIWAFTPDTAREYPKKFLLSITNYEGLNCETVEQHIFTDVCTIIRKQSEAIAATMENSELSKLKKLPSDATVQDIFECYYSLTEEESFEIHDDKPILENDAEMAASWNICSKSLEQALHDSQITDPAVLNYMYANWRLLDKLLDSPSLHKSGINEPNTMTVNTTSHPMIAHGQRSDLDTSLQNSKESKV